VNNKFGEIVSKITDIGKEWHSNDLLKNAQRNSKYVKKSLKDLGELTGAKGESAIVISAGPSVHKFEVMDKIKNSNFKGSIIAVDGSYVKCLKNGIYPDYVLSIDPHPTRIVRWFGDPDFEKHMKGDDYFTRQDLDVEFRNNTIKENVQNINLVNEHAYKTKLILCSSAPENVVSRSIEAQFDTYWWNPIVDNPREEGSLTKEIYKTNKLPCMNTGGTVGTAAWLFADSILKVKDIAVLGMDLGYHYETPYTMTQTYYELKEFASDEVKLKDLFMEFTFPLDGKKYYTDPTYYWYRKNMLELLQRGSANTFNCTEAGTLYGDGIKCIKFQDFLARFD
tara:strand:- start:150358 stop:151368 length:1011 start_codon:yes stop_codon:yes gene_type:complete